MGQSGSEDCKGLCLNNLPRPSAQHRIAGWVTARIAGWVFCLTVGQPTPIAGGIELMYFSSCT